MNLWQKISPAVYSQEAFGMNSVSAKDLLPNVGMQARRPKP